MRLFLDANVIFTAAHNPHGKAAFLISLAAEAGLQVITSDYALEEARRNLSRKAPDAVPVLDAMVEAFRVVADCPALPCPAALPDKDRPIFRAARASADVLLTGDLRDFGPLMNAPDRTDGLLIQTVAEFLNRL